jgi:hypothetical protein
VPAHRSSGLQPWPPVSEVIRIAAIEGTSAAVLFGNCGKLGEEGALAEVAPGVRVTRPSPIWPGVCPSWWGCHPVCLYAKRDPGCHAAVPRVSESVCVVVCCLGYVVMSATGCRTSPLLWEPVSARLTAV